MLIVLTLTTGCRSLRSETEVSTFEENEPFDRVQIEIDLELTGDPERIEARLSARKMPASSGLSRQGRTTCRKTGLTCSSP